MEVVIIQRYSISFGGGCPECPYCKCHCFLVDISKSLDTKRKRLESFTDSSIRASYKKVEEVWSTQRSERSVLDLDLGGEICLGQRWLLFTFLSVAHIKGCGLHKRVWLIFV